MCQNCCVKVRHRRNKRIHNGACTYCGKPSLTKKTICESCAINRAIERAEKIDSGICDRLGCNNEARPGKVSCERCAKRLSNRAKALKQKVLDHYGQVCNCICGCRVTNFSWLTIDHKNNDGAKQRKDGRHRGGTVQYRQIIRRKFPDDLQVLCWNCNCAKQYYGGCNEQAT